MKIIDCEQCSPEWFKAKAGIPSAASFDKIITTKGEPSKQRTDYLYQLAAEVLSGEKAESYKSPAMEHGIETETEARFTYELTKDVTVNQVGFCIADNGLAGCSPDGLLGDVSGIEIKCPMGKTHIKYLLDGRLPTEYFQQVQGSLYVTGYASWDFMSYFPGIKPLIITVYRDDSFIRNLHDQLVIFNHDLKEIVERLS